MAYVDVLASAIARRLASPFTGYDRHGSPAIDAVWLASAVARRLSSPRADGPSAIKASQVASAVARRLASRMPPGGRPTDIVASAGTEQALAGHIARCLASARATAGPERALEAVASRVVRRLTSPVFITPAADVEQLANRVASAVSQHLSRPEGGMSTQETDATKAVSEADRDAGHKPK